MLKQLYELCIRVQAKWDWKKLTARQNLTKCKLGMDKGPSMLVELYEENKK